MSVGQKEAIEKMERYLNAWKNIAPGKNFGGMTLDDFEAVVIDSKNARRNVIEKENQLTQAIQTRDNTDQSGLERRFHSSILVK